VHFVVPLIGAQTCPAPQPAPSAVAAQNRLV
jgi:hypothetical protein